MRQLQKQDKVLHQLKYFFQLSTDQLQIESQKNYDMIKKSNYYQESINFFPFSVNKKERFMYVVKKQKQLIESIERIKSRKSLQCIEKNFIVIREKYNDEILKTFYVDKQTLIIKKSFKSIPNQQDLEQFYLQSRIQNVENKFTLCSGKSCSYREKKKVVFGRLKVDSNTIGSDSKQMSKKHLLLFKSDRNNIQDKKIANFISCIKNACIHNTLYKLPQQIIKNIVSYVGIFQKFQFQIIDNNSTNYSYYKIKKQQIIMKPDKIYFRNQQKITLQFERSFISNTKYGQEKGRQQLKDWIQQVRNSIIGSRCYQKISFQKKDLFISAIVLKLKIKQKLTYYILTNQRQYQIGHGDEYDINSNQLSANRQLIGALYYNINKKKWIIKPENRPIWRRMQPKIHYQISGTTQIRLGVTNFYQIIIPD